MAALFKLFPVAPTGTHTGLAFVDYADRSKSGLQSLAVATYPPSPAGDVLRVLRIRCDLGLREACGAGGLSPMEFSCLENGRATLTADDWIRLYALVVAEWQRRNPPRG